MEKIKHVELSPYGGTLNKKYYQDFKNCYGEFLADNLKLSINPILDFGQAAITYENGEREIREKYEEDRF